MVIEKKYIRCPFCGALRTDFDSVIGEDIYELEWATQRIISRGRAGIGNIWSFKEIEDKEIIKKIKNKAKKISRKFK